ncbi:hypothetical protein GCM10017557_23580 [Streptomyces aurantiacus]|uniref:Uncharacterized protein n=1 Tax=Streptomyces aurantiacus TaxID=47760 RepID=A0A7G1NX42_9ACTN|nr:hypothetical protein GCM10017557_23580 [Streptomyces aurantiacus]
MQHPKTDAARSHGAHTALTAAHAALTAVDGLTEDVAEGLVERLVERGPAPPWFGESKGGARR